MSPSFLYCLTKTNSCRITEGAPPSLGAFFAETLPSCITRNRYSTLSFGEIPTSFYMGIQTEGLRGVVLSELTTKTRHMKYPTSDKVGVVVRSGQPKDYIHYFHGKEKDYHPSAILGWELFNPAAFEATLKEIHRDYNHEFLGSLFYVFHLNDLGRKLRFQTQPLWTCRFNNTFFERDLGKSLEITSRRDDALRALRFMDNKVHERQAIRQTAAQELADITKYIPFSITCFFLPPYAFHHKPYDAGTLPELNSDSVKDWEKTATECRQQTEKFLTRYNLNQQFHNFGDAVSRQIAERGYILDLGRIPVCPESWDNNNLDLTQSLKIKRNNKAGVFLNYDNKTLTWFNSAEGRPTGVEAALLSRPNLLGRGVKEAQKVLNALGYQLQLTPDLVQRLERKKKFYQFQEAPLHELQGHELVAYYNHGKYKCRDTVTNPDTKKPLWIKGHEYEIIPTWAKMEYAGGSEPIVDETNKIVGMEELSVRLSYLQLKIQTESDTVTISENQCRDNEEEDPTAPAKAWYPMLDEFIQAFGLPEVPTIMELRKDQLRNYYRRITSAMPDLKPYQVDCIIRNATKKGGIIGGTMGSGKTRMVIGTLILRDHMFNLIIVPPLLVESWMSHFKMYGLYAEKLLTHSSLDLLINRYKQLAGLPPEEKRKKLHARQEFYVTTPEFLTLGGLGNLVYDEWKAVYETKEPILDPITGEFVLDQSGRKTYEVTKHELTCTKYNAKSEHTAAKIPTGTRHNFWDHVKECPKCKCKNGDMTPKGFCRACGHRAFSYKGSKLIQLTCPEGHTRPLKNWVLSGTCPDCGSSEVTKAESTKETTIDIGFINELLEGIKGENNTSAAKVKSHYAYPAYRRIRGIFGAKAIDEVHLLANFNSQRGLSVASINTKETWVASGTIVRGYVTDLEASLCHVHGANTPIFPFYPWGKGREGFREQFVTERVKTTNRYAKQEGTRQSSSPMPEASNLNRLRRMLNCVTTTIGDHILEKEWKLPPIKRHYEEIWLEEANQTAYLQELNNIRSWFSGASTVERHRGALAKLWNLRLICDGIEKEKVVEKYVQQWLQEGHKFILTASTIPQYKKLCQILDRNKVKYITIDEKVAADKRDQATSKFADPKITALVSRTRLINVGLNTLIHADRLLIASLEYSPDILRQMEKRICRPGQKSKDLQVVYPIVRMKPKASVEEKMLKLVLEKEIAVKEMMEGKVRWQSAAELLEAARDKKGAAKVLEDVMVDTPETDLDKLFAEQTVSAEELNNEVYQLEKGNTFLEEEEAAETRISELVEQSGQYLLIQPEATKPEKKKTRRRNPKASKNISMESTLLLNLW